MTDKIKVAIKVRPLIEREVSEGLSVQWRVRDNAIFQIDGDEKQRGEALAFDYVFDQDVRNEDVFDVIARPIVESSVGGFNGTIFAYGQTSSGKTFTMMGGNGELGIIPLAIEYMFQTLSNIPNRQFLLRASYIEIYNEKVNDLLVKGKTSLKLREAPEGHVTITDLKEEVVTTPAKILDLMRRGEKIRRIGETNMNEKSSRSHTIFRIIIESRLPNEGEEGAVQVSHLNLVDLAGSERVDQSGARGDRLKEGCAINRSLFMLSHVISQLSEGQDQYVSFRDSKLTRILQSSIGGNAHTAIICAVTPAAVEETASTLGFASRAINVKNKPQINEVLSDSALLKRYARQIAKLQDELQKAKTGKKCNEFEEIESKLQEEVRRNELLQERIDLMKEKLIGSSAKSDLDLDKKRALRRRTWCGGASRKPRLSMFPVPNLDIIDEESNVNESQDSIKQSYFLCNSMHDIADSALFETPLEEFELQLINAEKRLSEESVESQEIPDSVTRRKGRHVTFAEMFDGCDSTVPILVDTSVQTDVVLVQSFLQRTFNTEATSTPPTVLRYRVQYYQNEYDSLREFTTLEKQVNVDYLKTLEEENSSLKQTISDAERLIVDANCTNSKLMDENKDLKQKLDCQSKKSADLTTTLLPLQDVQNSLSEKNKEVADLRKQLKTASLKISEMENMKNDFDMILEMSERKLKKRIEELTQSLDEAWQKLQVYEQQDSAVKICTISGVQNKLDMEEWMAKHLSLEQENEKLKESLDVLNLKLVNLASDVDCKLKGTEEFRMNSFDIKEAKEKGNLVEVLKQQIEKLNSEKENSLQEINHLNEQYKQLNQDYGAACNELVQKDRSVEKLNEQILGILAEKERDLKGYEDLKRAYEFLQQEKDSVTIELDIKNSFMIQLQEKLSITEKNNFILNQLNSEEKTNVEELKKIAENNLKQKDNYIGELNTQIEILRTDIDTKNKTLTENENQLDSLNQQIELLNAEIKSKGKEEEDLLVKYELLRKENENNKTLLKQKEDCINEHKSIIYKLRAEDDIKSKRLKENENELQSLTQQVDRLNSEILKKTKEESEMKSYLEQLSQDYDALCKEILERTQGIKDLELEVKQLKCELEIRSSKIQELQEQNELLKIHTVSSESTYTERDPVQDSPINNDETEKERNQITLLKLQMNSEIETYRSEIKALKESYEVVNNNYNILNEDFVKKQEEAELYRLKIEAMDLEKTTNLNIIQDLEQKLQQQNSNYETLIEKLIFNESHIKMMMAKYSTEKEADLTVINVLEEEVESLQLDLDMAVSEKNAYEKALVELENKMEAFKQQNEKHDSQKENYFKRMKELNGRCDRLSQQHKLLSEQLQEERLQQEKIKIKIEQLESEKITSLKNINEFQENGEWRDQEKLVTMPEIKQKNEQEEIYTHHNTLKQIHYTDDNTSEKSVSKEKCELLNQKYLEVTENLHEETIQLELLKSRVEELESEKETYFHTINMYTENIKVLREENEQLNMKLVEPSSLVYQIQVQNCDSEMLMCAQELKKPEQCQLKETEIIKSSDQLEKFETEVEQFNSQKEIALKVISNLTEDNAKLVKENENMKQQMEFIISEKRTCESAMQELKQREEILENELIEKSKQLDVLHVQIQQQNDTAQETVLKVTYELLNQDYLELARKLQEGMQQLELLESRVEQLESEKEVDLNAVDKFTEDIKLLREENEKLSIKLLESSRMCDMLKIEVQEKNSEVEIIVKELENQKNQCAHLMEEHKIINEKFPVTKERLEELLTEVEQLKYEKENDRKIIGELTEGNSKLVKDNKNMKEQMEFISEKCACESAIQELKQREEVLEKELVKKSEQLELLHVQIQQQNDTAEETVLKVTYELLNQDYLELAGKLQEATKQLELLNSRIEKLESEKEVDLNAVNKFTEEIKLLQEENEQLNTKLLETSRMCDTFKIQVQEKNSEVEIIVKELENQKNQCADLLEEHKIINEEFPVTKEQLEELLTEVEQLKCEKENDRKIIGELTEGNSKSVKDNKNMKEQMEFISEKCPCESAIQELKQREEVLENELVKKSKQLDLLHVQIQQQNDTAEETVLKVTYELLNQDYLELAGKLQEATKQLELLNSRIEKLESEKEVDLNAVNKFTEEIKLLQEENEQLNTKLLETSRMCDTFKIQVQEKNSEVEIIVKELENQKNQCAHLLEEHKIINEEFPVTKKRLEELLTEVEQLKYEKEEDRKIIGELTESNSKLVKDNKNMKEQMEFVISEKSACESAVRELKQREEVLEKELVKKSEQLNLLHVQIQQQNDTAEETVLNVTYELLNQDYLELAGKLQEATKQLELLNSRVEKLESEKEVDLNAVDKFTEDINLLQEENEQLNTKLLETSRMCDTFKIQVQEKNSEVEMIMKELEIQKNQCAHLIEEHKIINEEFPVTKERLEELLTEVEQLKYEKENDRKIIGELREGNTTLVKDNENMKQQMEFIISEKSACESSLQELKQREEVLENELIEKSKQLDVFHAQIQQQNDTAEETVLKVTYDLLNQDYLELARKLEEGTKHLELLKCRIKELESEKEVDMKAVDKFTKDIKLVQEEDELLETIRLNESFKLQVQEKNSEIEMIVEEQKNHSAHLKEEHKNVTEKLPILVTSEQLRVMNAEDDQLKYQKENDSDVITKLKEDNSQLAKDNEHLKQQMELILILSEKSKINMKALKHREELLNNERLEESRQLDVLQVQIQQGNVTEEKIILEPDLVLDDKLQEGTIQLELLKSRVEELESEKEVNLNIVDKFTEDIKLLQEENEQLNTKLLETNKLCDIFKLEVQQRNSELEIKVKQLNEEKIQFELSNEELKVVNEKLLLTQEQLEELMTKVEQLKSQKENDKQLINKLTEDKSNLVKDIEIMKHQMEAIVSAKSACESTMQELKQREEVLKNELVEKNRQMDMLQVQMHQQTDPVEETVLKESYEILNKNYPVLDGNLKKETIQLGLLQSRVGELESENNMNLNTIDKLTENIKVLQEENEKLKTKLVETSRLYDTFKIQLQEKNYEVEMKVKQLKEVNNSYELSNEELKIVNEKFLATSEHLEELKTEIEQLKCQKENDNKLISKLTEVNKAELEKANRTLFEKRREIESCRSMLVKEILSLSLEADKKTITEYKLTDLVSKLLGLIMEKEKELIDQLQQQLQNECAEKEEIARNSAEKERRNEAWIKELESDNERLQADLSKLESEKKNLGNHGKINALEEEKFQLVKSLRDAETSIVVLQRDMKRVVSENTNSVKKLKDLQILTKEKDDEISALQNKVEEQIQNLRELTNMVEIRNKGIRQKEVVIVELKEQVQKFVTQETESQFTGQQKQILEKEIENLKSDNSNLLELLDNKLRELAEREASSSVLREELNNAKVCQQQLEAFEKEISCLKSKKTQLTELLEIKVNELKQKDASFSQTEEELIRKNRDLESKLHSLNEKLSDLNDTNLNLEEMYKKNAEDIIQKDATISQLQVELKELKKLEIRYEDSNLQLQSTEKELIYWKDNSNQLIEENKELNHNLNLEREKSQEATDKLTKITIDMEQTLEDFHGKISDLEHILSEEKLKQEKLQNEIKDLFNNNVRLEAEAKTYKNQFNELNAAVMKEREKYSATISDLKNISDELEKVRAQERKLTEVKKAITDRLCAKENHCLKLEKELSKIMTVKDERDRLLHKCELLNKEHTEVTNHIIELIKLLEQYLQQSSSVSSNIDSISDSFMKISQYVQQLGCENMKLRNSANTQGIKCSSEIPTEIECLRTELQQALDEKNALDEENEMMLTKIRGLEKMNTSLYHEISSLEEEIKDTEKELDTALKKVDSVTKENENLTLELGNMHRQLLPRIRELEAENEDLKDKNNQLLKEREGATHHDRLCTQENHCLKLEKELSKIMTVKDERDRLLHKCELLNKEHIEVTNHIIELIKLLEQYLQQSGSVSSNIDNISNSFMKISQYVQQLGCENMKLRNSANTQGIKCSSEIPTEIECLRTELQQALDEKIALDEENEMMLTKIRGLEKMNTSLYHEISSLEEEIKYTEKELDTAVKKVDSVTKENENLTVELGNMRRQLLPRIRELEAENEDLKDRNNQLLKESEGVTHYIQELSAKCAKLELGCKKVRPTSSVATLTEASGDCVQLAERLEQAKQAILERNMKITTLELQIKTEEFPFQEKVKDLQSVVSSYKSRNMELKSELRRLQLHIEDSRKNCENCKRHELKVLKEVSIQTDDECDHLMEYGGSGLIREDMLIKMRNKNKEQQKKIEYFKNLCREKRNQVINLRENLEKHLNNCLCHSGRNSEVLEEEKTENENASSHAGRNSEEPSKDVHTQTENSAEPPCPRQSDVREDVLHKMTVKINDLQKDNEMLRIMCRERRVKMIDLENKLSRFTPCTNVEQQESQRVKKLYSAGVLPGHRTGLVRHPLSVNKENEPISEAYKRHAGHPGPHYLLHRGPNNGTKETRQPPP